MALLDGDNGFGHLVMKKATELAIEKARTCGVAWVGSRLSNHAGPASLYARMPLAHDMIGVYFAVGNANHLPPWGGLDMLLSTNPIAVAIPAGEEPPVVLDMATTVAAYGKVKAKAQRGEQMPIGWMIDRLGQPLTDPKRADEGFLMPIGGYKGYGLALIVGLLAGTLNGAAMGSDVIDFNKDFRSVTNTGQAILVIDPAAFGDVAGLQGPRRHRGARDARQRAHAGRRPHLAARRTEPHQAPQRTRRHGAAAHPARPARRHRGELGIPTLQKHEQETPCAHPPPPPARPSSSALSPPAHRRPRPGAWPSAKPIRIIVPLAAGSAVDNAARIVAQKMGTEPRPVLRASRTSPAPPA
jgi:hypothetical protein